MKEVYIHKQDEIKNKREINLLLKGIVMAVIGTIGIAILMGMIAMQRFIGEYKNDEVALYHAWYDIYIEEPQELTKFVKPYVGEWGITAEYQYESDHSVIAPKYEDVFKKLHWDLQKEEGKTKTYVKNDLICDLTELEGNKWQVKISVKGYHDKGFFEKLIFGNTKTA